MASALKLYSSPTQCTRKVPIALEELGLTYEFHPVSLGKKETTSEWYQQINVFEKIPTLTDGPVTIPDSGAALLYLATKHDSTTFSFPHDTQAFWTMTQLLFYASQIDFLQGNSWRARVLAKEAGEEFTPSKISDYLDTQLFRSYRLLDKKLAQERASYGAAEVEKSGGPWLAGNKYSYADMAIYPYYAKASQYVWAKAKLDQFKELTAWAERVGARDAVKKGMLKGEEFGEVL